MANYIMSPCPRKRRSTSLRSDRLRPGAETAGGTGAERGFSLSEALVALAITSMVFLAALSMLSIDNRIYHRDDAVLEVTREARHTLETLEHDLLMTGFLVDKQTIADVGPDGTADTGDDMVGQSAVVYAAPYELVVNADVNPEIEAIVDGNTGDALPTGYAPVTFHTGAETLRYTLDSTGDGTINAADRQDEAEEAVVDNAGLYLLRREVYGDNGTDNRAGAGPVGLVRGPAAYPSGAKPMPLFQYWGTFYNRKGLTLWGDTGAGGGVAYNGVLEPGELAALTAVTDEDANDNAVMDAGEDRNANGVLDRRVGDLVKKVDIHVTTETPYPDMKYADKTRSSTTTPFRFRTVTMSTQIKPRNIDLPGGACGDQPHPTSSVTVENACADALADGKVRITWALSSDDGGGEMDVEKYIMYRTDVDSIFGTTPYSEANKGVTSYEDDWIIMRTWPPRQYWYKLRAMDCTPQLSVLDPTGGAYPPKIGGQYPEQIEIRDIPGDDGTQLEVVFGRSVDEMTNTSGYGGVVKKYYIHRSTSLDYRCVPPVNNLAIDATNAPVYTFTDNDTNSTSGLAWGTIYYYWMRAQDAAGGLSPYSPRYCGRSFKGPTFPSAQYARIAEHAVNDHPVEIFFSQNQRNEDAGYDPYLIDYNIYRANDYNGDGTINSLVDHSAGYRLSDRVASIRWTGLIYAAGGDSPGTVHQSLDGGTNWREVGSSGGFRPNGLAFGSRLNAVVVGESGKAYYSTTGGATWSASAISGSDDLSAVTFLSDRVVMAVGNNGTVLKSTDGGASFSSLTVSLTEDLTGIASDGNFVVVVGDGGAAARSVDGGVNWTVLGFAGTSDLYGVALAREGSGDRTVLIGAEDRIWRSGDSGVNWTPLDFPGAGRFRGVAVVPGGPAMAVVTSANAIYRTTDGVTWATEGPSPNGPLAVTMLNATIAWVSDSNGTVYHRNQAGSWSNASVSAGDPLRALAARPELAWEDLSTKAAGSGATFFYVVTAAYAQSSALDGEAGVILDRPGPTENPDDGEDQILVDSCNSIELGATMP